MQGINAAEHLGDVEPGMAVVQDTSVVQQSPEVATRHILHRQVDLVIILEGIQKLDEPFALSGSQDVTLCENMPDLIQFEQQLLAHHLQRAHLARVLLLCQIHLSIATLADLRQDLEVVLAQTGPTLAQMRPFAAQVFEQRGLVFFGGCGGRIGIGGLELVVAGLAVVDVAEEVEVVVEEVFAESQNESWSYASCSTYTVGSR